MVAPPCPLPDALRKGFSRHARKVARRWSGRDVGEIVRRHEVMPLLADATALLALRVDGTVVEVAWRSPDVALPVADVRTRDIALIHAARRSVELRALRPVRSDVDLDCPMCRGTRPFEQSMPSITCFCAGLGFLPAAWDEPEQEASEAAQPVPSRRAAAIVAPGVAEAPDVTDDHLETDGQYAQTGGAPRPRPDLRTSAREGGAARADEDTSRDAVPAGAIPRASMPPRAPSPRLLTIAGVMLALGGAGGGVAVAASHDLQSLGLALGCALGLLPGVLLLAWISAR